MSTFRATLSSEPEVGTTEDVTVELTPAQKAARTRAANKAAKALLDAEADD
ncbi:head protein [Pectobacterium phage PPWS4]|uniref:Uncharacterized protein n=1 Tax=Pectobacterium phage PPWS4 TaxID=1961914 RepID=A0A250KAX2_9CAUD|nr:head protein [Pectobacterium phage PPWS4]BBA26453.1 hypothetical protein [Pectobacterium phage PPWS4]